jgi:S1-C subfamily serine protease
MKSVSIKVLITILAIAAIFGGSFYAVKISLGQPASAATALFDENAVESIYNTASPSVFEIFVTLGSGYGFSSSGEAQGSGFLIDNNGDILTNNHVVDGATSITVMIPGKSTVSAKVLGASPVYDLAVINVPASAVSGLSPLQFDDSSQVKIGQMALALGSPYDLTNTLTLGVVSGLNRAVEGSNLTGMIQTDAALNPGNSGGPLLDSAGKVIGINTAIEAETGATGLGFAVPSNIATKIIPSLKSGTAVEKPWIGIQAVGISQLTVSQAAALNLSVAQGVYVTAVTAGSPAATAGLKAGGTDTNGNPTTGGDVITAVDGKAVGTVQEIQAYLAGKNVGDKVTLTVIRAGQTISVQVTLAAWPNTTTTTTPGTPRTTPPSTTTTTQTASVRPWLGITSATVTQSLASSLGLSVNQGAYVVEVTANSPAAKAGLIAGGYDASGNPKAGGDVITSVDGKAITNTSSLSSYLLTKKPGDTVTLTVIRNGQNMNVTATLGTWPANP